jgi:hypothetical protein
VFFIPALHALSYSRSTLSGLEGIGLFFNPALHAGLFTFNPFRVGGFGSVVYPRISFIVIHVQPRMEGAEMLINAVLDPD